MDPITWLTLTGRREPSDIIASYDDRGVSCRWPDGSSCSVAWEDLRAVEIRTTDAEPPEEAVFLVLRGARGDCVIPQQAEGSDDVIERLQKLPDFDNYAALAAMESTGNATFSCWEAPGSPEIPRPDANLPLASPPPVC